MAIFDSYVKLPEGRSNSHRFFWLKILQESWMFDVLNSAPNLYYLYTGISILYDINQIHHITSPYDGSYPHVR